MHRSLFLAAAMVAAVPYVSSADYNYGDLRQYNLVLSGNLTSGNEVEGSSIVGGNVSGSAENFGIRLNSSTYSGKNSLIVGGGVSGGPDSLQAGNLAVGSGASVSATINYNGGGSRVNTDVANLSSDLSMALKNASTNLLAMAPQGGSTIFAPSSGTNYTFTTSAANTTKGVAVFNVDGGFFSSSNVQSINLVNASNATSIIFNVSGTTDSVTRNFVYGSGTLDPLVLFNFYQATSLSLGTQVEGSILAANAAVSNSTALNGTLFAASLNQGGELHLTNQSLQNAAYGTPLYSGILPTLAPATVPEPTTVLSTATGLAFAGLVGWRRRRRA